MRIYLRVLLAVFAMNTYAQPFFFTINNNNGVITCVSPQASISITTNYTGTVLYEWSGPNYSATGPSVTMTVPGLYTLKTTYLGITFITTVPITVNTVVPASSLSSTFQSFGMNDTPQNFTFTAVSPTTNVSHYFYSSGANPPYIINSATAVYLPPSSGTYTHCLVDNSNGCTICKTFVYELRDETGLKDLTLQQAIIFPNPNNGVFQLRNYPDQLSKAEVYNSTGQLIASSLIGQPEFLFDIREQPQGIYFIKLIDRNGQHAFVKMIRD